MQICSPFTREWSPQLSVSVPSKLRTLVTSLGSDLQLFPRFNHITFQILSLVDAILVVSIFFFLFFFLFFFFTCVHFCYHFLLSGFSMPLLYGILFCKWTVVSGLGCFLFIKYTLDTKRSTSLSLRHTSLLEHI